MSTPDSIEAPKADTHIIDPHAPATFGERVSRILGAVAGDPTARAEIDMARVLEELRALGAQPIEDCTPEEARRQPSPADAVSSLMAKYGISDPDYDIPTRDASYESGGEPLGLRIYRPANGGDPRPIVVYYPGGGWVLSNLDDYDSSARAIAARTGAVVVAVETRRAPEHKFPAAHDDAIAAYAHVLKNAEAFGGTPDVAAVVGESAGGNLAINVAIAARDHDMQPPVHLALIYPIAGVDTTTPSFRINEFARPVNKAIIEWIFGHALMSPSEKEDPRLDVVGRADLAGLPPTTLLTAEIDPLRSEGLELGNRLRAAGVDVNGVDFEGVSHGFFGMGAIVRHARTAQEIVGRDLAAAFAVDGRGCRVGRAL
ncbi:alpha/beta hydrolase [Chelatococcus sambhunathii]|uniref:Alpha/beta hydrolase n=1 Tax=Chelatococcus sambhunathii TaxID=363953 RepID=A0ABU1DGL8_9HYPH|nr:alpha/beta hydrolase [Chelatococcus sambhunathii]MDR4307055.1 alpha/beta hydrolase [Chelatococcus sambhunathii]